MLLNSFFMVDPFNAYPYIDNDIVNLVGGGSFTQNTVFRPGKYSVDVQAGSSYVEENTTLIIGKPALIKKEISITQPFIVRAYCGSSGTATAGGMNPYSGSFKVNANTTHDAVPGVSHIFGNTGSTAYVNMGIVSSTIHCSTGNCLGDGTYIGNTSSGAGSCLHIMPANGTFGTDYLFAFHCVAGTIMNTNGLGGGVGSAYGGAGSGSVYVYTSIAQKAQSYDGGSTPYGAGGKGVETTTLGEYKLGNNGSGPGYGYGGGHGVDGGGAWFDGEQWLDSRTVGEHGTDGHIILKYLRPLNA